MTKLGYIYLLLIMLLTTTVNSAMSSAMAAEVCTDLVKPVRYKVKKGDHIAEILRTFKLEPVFGTKGSLAKLLQINHIPNQNLIQPGDEILIPFRCEEQITGWSTQSKDQHRTVELKKIKVDFTKETATSAEPKTTTPAVASQPVEKVNDNVSGSAEPTEPVKTEDVKMNQILNNSAQSGQNIQAPPDVEAANKTPEEISDALRYRMICEGEWTGTQCISRYSVIFAALSGWYNRYDGIDPAAPNGQNNKGILLSRMNPQVEFGWHNYWMENFKTELSASLQHSTILPEAREIPIEQDKKLLSSIYAQARYETGAFGIGIGLKNYDKLFYRFRFSGLSQPCFSNNSSFAGCGVFVHSANIMSYFINGSWIFYQAGKYTVDVKAELSYLGTGATGGFDIYEGQGASVAFTLRHDRVREYLYGSLYYGMSSQNTSIEIQNAQELGFVFGYAWKLKDW